jgi:hypothetical protein
MRSLAWKAWRPFAAKWSELARNSGSTPRAYPPSVRNGGGGSGGSVTNRGGRGGRYLSGETVPLYGPTKRTAMRCSLNHCQMRYLQVQSPSRPCEMESPTTITLSPFIVSVGAAMSLMFGIYVPCSIQKCEMLKNAVQ